MSSIKLESNASGTGIFTIASPNSNTNRTLTLPDNTGTILTGSSSITRSQLPAGSVLQVVSTTKTDTFSSSSSGSWIDITGMSVSITPTSSSNRILVSYNIVISNNNGWYVLLKLVRGSTDIAIGDAAGSRTRATTAGGLGASVTDYPYLQSMQFLDSPATTSSTTYKLQMYFGGNTSYVNRSPTDGDTVGYPRAVSTITVMEIAA
jgi:hypothetical protein